MGIDMEINLGRETDMDMDTGHIWKYIFFIGYRTAAMLGSSDIVLT